MVHGRDHEHGGADPHRIHYQSVGGAGGAGSQGVYTLDSGTDLSGGLHLFQWAHAGGATLLDIASDAYHPQPAAAGVYAYTFDFRLTTRHSYAVAVGNYAIYGFSAMGSSEFSSGWQETRYQAVANVYYFLLASGAVTLHQDPDAGSGAYLTASVSSNISGTETGDKYEGGVYVQKVN
jgi:hypothetical protein